LNESFFTDRWFYDMVAAIEFRQEGNSAMKTLLVTFAAGSMAIASATSAFACPAHSASAKHNMSVAETTVPADSQKNEAMSTFNPAENVLEESAQKAE
jgi:hypothetical protein